MLVRGLAYIRNNGGTSLKIISSWVSPDVMNQNHFNRKHIHLKDSSRAMYTPLKSVQKSKLQNGRYRIITFEKKKDINKYMIVLYTKVLEGKTQ